MKTIFHKLVSLACVMFFILCHTGCGEGGGTGGGGGAASYVAPPVGNGGQSNVTSVAPTAELAAIADTVLLLNFNGNTTDATGVHADTDNGTTNDNVNLKYGGASRDFLRTSSQYVAFADHADWDFVGNDFAIEFWMRTTNTNLMYVFGQYGAACTSNTNTVSINVNNTANKVQAIINDAGTNRAITGTTTVTDGSWHHVKLVRNSNSLVLYVDGYAEGASLSGLGNVPGSTNGFAVGRPGDCNNHYYDGNLDDFRIVK